MRARLATLDQNKMPSGSERCGLVSKALRTDAVDEVRRRGLAIVRRRHQRRGRPLTVHPGRSAVTAASACTKPHAGPQKFLRVDRFAVDPGFVVQMRTGGSAG